MRLTPRDRLLAGLFALQLLAVVVFGVAVLHGLDHDGGARTTTITQALTTPQASGAAVGSGPRGGTAGAAGTVGVPGSRSSTVAGGATGGTGGAAVPDAGTSGPAVVAAGAPIKIGAIVSQTGPINFVASAQGTKAYLDRVNAAGGANGHQISLDLRDDQLDATRGAQQAQALLAEGVFAFAAWNAPQTEGTIVPFLTQNKIPLIGSYGVGDEYHSPWAYAFESHHYGYEMGRFLAQEPKVKHPGVIFTGNSSSKVNDAQVRAFTAGVKAGGKTLSSNDIIQVDVTKVSYDDAVTQFRLAGVDGIATLIDQTAYNRLQQSMDRQGYHPVHVADPLFTDPSVTQSTSTDGTLVASDFTATDVGGAEVADYVSTTRKAFGAKAQISYLGETGWLDAKVLVEAITRMGSTITRSHLLAVMNSLPSSVGQGFTQPLHFGAVDQHDLNQCLSLTRIVNGRAEAYKGPACDTLTFDR